MRASAFRFVGVAMMLMVATLVLSAPGGANFNTDYSGYCEYQWLRECFPDSPKHNWDWDLGPRFGNVTLDSLYNTYDTTDLEILPSGNINDGEHATNVDVYLHYGEVAAGWAVASCQSPVNTSHRCDHFHVIYDAGQLVRTLDDDRFFKKVACHELGHTVGMAHPEANPHVYFPNDPFFGCMRGGESLNGSLGAHGANDHINQFSY